MCSSEHYLPRFIHQNRNLKSAVAPLVLFKATMGGTKPSPVDLLTPERLRALKKRLRSQRWHPQAVEREIALIQKLREQLSRGR
jgi:hypothetical protein